MAAIRNPLPWSATLQPWHNTEKTEVTGVIGEDFNLGDFWKYGSPLDVENPAPTAALPYRWDASMLCVDDGYSLLSMGRGDRPKKQKKDDKGKERAGDGRACEYAN